MILLLEIACKCTVSIQFLSLLFYRIDNNGVIKVADFGLTEEIYTKNYFNQFKESNSSVKLPAKWMAIESFHDGVFSEKSDVVSIAIQNCDSKFSFSCTVVFWCIVLGSVQCW